MHATLSTAKRILGGEVFAYDLFPLKIGSLEEALQQAGYGHADHVSTKRGAWEIFRRQDYSFTPFLPSQSGKLTDSAAAVYRADGDFGEQRPHYTFMTRPGAEVQLEEMVRNAQQISSGIIESWPTRFIDWLSSDYSPDGLKTPLFVVGSMFAGGMAGVALGTATGNGDTGKDVLMMLVGTFIIGPVAAASPLIKAGINYLLTSASMSNAGNYAFGKEATAALDTDLAMLRKHRVAIQAYSALFGLGQQMSRDEFWSIFTGIQESGFLLKRMDPVLLNRPGFGAAASVIALYA